MALPALAPFLASAEPHRAERARSAFPAELEAIILKAMARNPRDRYDSAAELADDLERFAVGSGVPLARRVDRSRIRRRLARHASDFARRVLAVLDRARRSLTGHSIVPTGRSAHERSRTLQRLSVPD